jgi:SNF2 family DNA or RNA helicase
VSVASGAGKTVISIAIILRGLEAARAGRSYPNKSSATLVIMPPGLIDQWKSEIKKVSDSLQVICIYDMDSLSKVSVRSMIEADVVLCPVDILESNGYLENLLQNAKKADEGAPKLPRYVGQTETSGAKGVWIPQSSTDPYGGGNNPNNQVSVTIETRSYYTLDFLVLLNTNVEIDKTLHFFLQKRRNESARFTYVYIKAIQLIRSLVFDNSKKSIPLEYFEWERVIVDEIHESLCTSKDEIKLAKEASAEDDRGFFQEKNRRAGRELLGVMTKDIKMRPLVYRKAIFGLSGTPLLDR